MLDINDKDTLYRAITEKDERPPLTTECPEQLNHLMQSCWDKDPAKRPTFRQGTLHSLMAYLTYVVLVSLEGILVDCAIRDPVANKFWKENFPAKVTLVIIYCNLSSTRSSGLYFGRSCAKCCPQKILHQMKIENVYFVC
jgi:hypothetical protein